MVRPNGTSARPKSNTAGDVFLFFVLLAVTVLFFASSQLFV